MSSAKEGLLLTRSGGGTAAVLLLATESRDGCVSCESCSRGAPGGHDRMRGGLTNSSPGNGEAIRARINN